MSFLQEPRSRSFLYLLKADRQSWLHPCLRHVIACLHIDEQFGIDTKSCLCEQCKIACHRPFAIKDFIKHSIRNPETIRKPCLRYLTRLKFFLEYVAWVCRDSFCIVHNTDLGVVIRQFVNFCDGDDRLASFFPYGKLYAVLLVNPDREHTVLVTMQGLEV